MNHSDLINGIIEFISSLFVILNIIKLYKDKEVKGVSIICTIFFTSWGIWNIYFYPANKLYLSFIGGLFIALFNSIWVGQMFYYNHKNKINGKS
jgi:uncharacterized membrane protein YfcA